MNTIEFFTWFKSEIEKTSNWAQMVATVEDSPWHREANVSVHTNMTIHQYMTQFYDQRSERQRMLSLMALLFHDFGKPEAEETLEKKEEPGVFYRRYAGHEPISGNEFMSFMCDQDELRQVFFDQGYDWSDIRKIKVMIEHHLPYGLKNVQKRQNLKQMIDMTFAEDDVCFYDMLRSDAAGRISDDHETKLLNVELWIENFQLVEWKARAIKDTAPELIMLVGVSGAGKSTYISKLISEGANDVVVFNEDVLRLQYAQENMAREELAGWADLTDAEWYQKAWNFCHLNKESKFDAFSMAEYRKLLDTGKTIKVVIDRMNQGRKGRNKYIDPAKQKGYRVKSVEFFISEQRAKDRQKTRGDKMLPDFRVHQIVMQLETPWYGPEVDEFIIVPQH
jgi:predicted kinase